MLSWGVGFETVKESKDKEKKKKGSKRKGSKTKSKSKGRSKREKSKFGSSKDSKDKEKEPVSDDEEEKDKECSPTSISTTSGNNIPTIMQIDDFLPLEPAWYTHSYSSLGSFVAPPSGSNSPSPPASPRYLTHNTTGSK